MSGRQSSTPIRYGDELTATRPHRRSVRRAPSPPPSIGAFPVANRVEKPAKKREAIPSPEPETRSIRRESVHERTWVVVDRPQSMGNDLCDRFGVFLVGQQVSGDARRPRDRHPVENDPPAGPDCPVVESDVGSARLPITTIGHVAFMS